MGALGFSAPWLLLALLSLPLLWWLLRAVPPAPLRRRFPALTLLLGLRDQQAEMRTTPWWLILIRIGAFAAMILGFAGPLLTPKGAAERTGPLVILIDSFWPAAADWPVRLRAAEELLTAAQQAGRPVAVIPTRALRAAPPGAAQRARETLAALTPVPWDAPYDMSVGSDLPKGQTIWISDGVARAGRGALLAAREQAGPVQIWERDRAETGPVLGLLPPELRDGTIQITALRSHASGGALRLRGWGPDPAGRLRVLTETELQFSPDERRIEQELTLPPELRHRIRWFELAPKTRGGDAASALSAGQIALVGEALTRRRVALLGGDDSETLALLSPDHFLRAALAPGSDLIEALNVEEALRASPNVVILPDVANLSATDHKALTQWVAKGGLLLRFAGPRLAAAQMKARAAGVPEDPLLPVRLRGAGRRVGGAMSWGAPQKLAPFAEDSPFYGLAIPEDVTVSRQVLAEPGPDVAKRTLARLADGTPLITRKLIGAGQVVLVHVSANAEWSNLALSGLFVDMLERLTAASSALQPALHPMGAEAENTFAEGFWRRAQTLSATGALQQEQVPEMVPGAALLAAATDGASAKAPAGIYTKEGRQVAVNALAKGADLAPARWPASVVPQWGRGAKTTDLSGPLLSAALLLLLVDTLATLWLSGRLPALRRVVPALGLAVLASQLVSAGTGFAQTAAPVSNDQPDAQVISAAAEVTLAHVLTGTEQLDALAQAGLTGLSNALFARSSVEPAPPVGVDLEHDELSVYPLLYWPVSATQPLPSAAAYQKLSKYLAAGGLILFDTRDAGTGGDGAEARALRALAAPLSLPPLEPVPGDHVLTRSFYLLDHFPGRYDGPVWAEAAPPGATREEGLPFRRLNDGVTPVLIGGNDWAGAWAVGPGGAPLLPVGRGFAGERQREMAFRFGINLVMHVLTGNYKSDQVHVPALLERLGQ